MVALAVLRPVPHGESDEERAAEIAGRRHQAQESFDRARDTLPAPVRAAFGLELAENSDVARTLCDYADTHVFELLVLGRRGTGGIMHRRLGHVGSAACVVLPLTPGRRSALLATTVGSYLIFV